MIGRRLGISLAAAAFVLLVVGSYAVAGPRDGPPKVPDSKKFEARLNGFQEVPSVSTEAFGRFEAELVNDTTLHYTFTYEADLQGKHRARTVLCSDTWVNDSGTWKTASTHCSLVKGK